MRFEHFLEQSAVIHGDKTALVAGGTRLSYAAFDRLAQRLANGLAAHDVNRSDRVLVFMDNCAEAAVSIFAVLKAGATFSVINPSTKAAKLAYIIANCEPRAILTSAKLLDVALAAREAAGGVSKPFVAAAGLDAPVDGVEAFETLCAGAADPIAHGGTAQDLAMLVYTSGSTGRPKGVMMTHANVDAASASITTYLESTAGDIIFSALPLAFDYGLYQLLMAVRKGATLVLENSFAFPSAMFELMRREAVTGLPLVPTMAALILQMRSLSPNPVPSLRYITNTAAALPVEHIERLRQIFPDAALYSMYGLTECKRCTYLPPSELDRRPGSVGIAIPGTEAYVVDEHGVVKPGMTGELVVQGPHVMAGYWRDEEASARVLKPGPNPTLPALHTGDLFRQDADGFLYFVGRKDDIIKTRGEKVAPKEVEAVLHAHPAVAEAVVAGIDDPILGQAISALVVLSDTDVTARELIRHCQLNLEDFMVPKHLAFTTSLPKTDTGKVSRRLAADMLEAAR
ncbi:class I adenylate-forming enzyme family protein [Rhizobium sp.]